MLKSFKFYNLSSLGSKRSINIVINEINKREARREVRESTFFPTYFEFSFQNCKAYSRDVGQTD